MDMQPTAPTQFAKLAAAYKVRKPVSQASRTDWSNAYLGDAGANDNPTMKKQPQGPLFKDFLDTNV